MKDYVSFHNHTTYSLLDSLIKPRDLFYRAKELGQSAIAVTDHATLAAAHDSLIASKESGVKLIMGCEFNFVDDLSLANKTDRWRHVILCAKNYNGYKNLLKLHREANNYSVIAFKKTHPRIDWSLLEKYSSDLICTTACSGGILGQLINTRQIETAKQQARRLKDIFGDDLAFEIQPHALKRQVSSMNDYIDQTLVNNILIKFGKELDVKIIISTDAHYLYKEDAETHDVGLAVGSGQPVESNNRLRYYNTSDNSIHAEFYMKSRDEVVSFFSRLYKEKAEEWANNTLYFAEKCEFPDWIDPAFTNPSKRELPDFPVKNQPDYKKFLVWKHEYLEKECPEDEAYLRYLVYSNLESRAKLSNLDVYKARIEDEFEVIAGKKFNSYMLIVADILDFCRKNNISTGYGRGSAGGSLIAYLARIHEADPLKYNLIFERFQNREKTAMPDIDLDFSKRNREKVLEYIYKKYGNEYVAQIANYMELTPKPYARAISRVYKFGGDFKSAVKIGNEVAGAIPDEVHKVSELMDNAPLYAEYAKVYPQLYKHSKKLGNIFAAFSKHAAGLVIGKRKLEEVVPLRVDKEGAIVLEYEKERAEANGLVKMDILGLETLDIIDDCLELIKKQGKQLPSDPFDFEMYDEKTYDLISSGNTFAVFQLGTSGATMDLCRKIKPKSILDLALINALARPATADIRDDFAKVRNGEKPMELLHPSLQRAFGFTYGFGLFEESLMFLAQDVAGWTLNEADALRKLTKEKGKNPEKAAKLRKNFIDKSVENNIDVSIATTVWDDVISKFSGYGFNLSHAVFYSFLGFKTAYLKAHYPLEFLTANLIAEANSNAKNAPDNILKIKQELRSSGVKVLPPDINKSEMTYNIIDDNTLLTGFDSLKFMSNDAIPEIIAHRPYTSFEDFMRKVSAKKVKINSIYALIGSGCFDCFGMSRKQMYLYAADYRKKLSLYLSRAEDANQSFNYPFPEVGDFTIPEKHAFEIFFLGEGLTGSSFDIYPGFFDKSAVNFSKLIKDFPDKEDNTFGVEIPSTYGYLQGIIENFFTFKIKKETSKNFGREMGKISIRDPYGNSIGMTLFSDDLEKFRKDIKKTMGSKFVIEPGVAINFSGALNWYEGTPSLILKQVRKIAGLPQKPSKEQLKPQKVTLKIPNSKKKKSNNLLEFLEEVNEELEENGITEPIELEKNDLLDIDELSEFQAPETNDD
jgi:DNA polymerase-3 subunit alpha